MARHSSPPRRHALETRRTPAHRRTAADTGTHRGADPAPPVRRGTPPPARRVTAVTVAGGALSLAGAGAAGWMATTHLPDLLDVVLEAEVAPSARTVTLVGLGTPVAEDNPTEQLATVDPAAVAASATKALTAPTSVAAPKPATPKDTTPQPSTPAPPTSKPTQQPAPASTAADQDDANQDDANQDDAEDDANQDEANAESGEQDDDSDRTGDDRPGRATSDNGSNDSDSDSDSDEGSSTGGGSDTSEGSNTGSSDGSASDDRTGSGSGSADDSRSGTDGDSGATGAPGVDSPISPGLPTNTGPVDGELPSELIDTKDWYLTLPTGKEGSPDLVEGSALARYHSEFFQLTPAKDGVAFTAGTGGVTTSGSHYPRSELREMFGSEKASWDGRKGRHTMEIVQAITETPKEKPDVIAGQIHGTSDDLMQIHLSGQQLRVKYADGQKYVDLDPNYRLGTMFAVRIESSGGRVKVWYNGQQKADLPISSSTSYFKAGVYTNSNPSKGDRSGEGQVVIRSLSVRHE